MRLGRIESFVGNSAFLLVTTALFCVCGLLTGDRLKANDGLGWDGVTYARYVQGLGKLSGHPPSASRTESPGTVSPDASNPEAALDTVASVAAPERKRGINPFYFHRLAPIVAVHLGLRAFQLEHSNANIVRAFLWLNAICLVLAAFFWLKALDLIGCNGYAKLIGYCALFVNFASLKMPFYDPVLMDTASFLVAIVQLYFYFSRRRALLWLVTLLGAFTHPWLFYLGAVLFLVPYAPDEREADGAPPKSGLNSVATWVVIALVTTVPWAALVMNPALRSESQPAMNALRIAAVGLGGVLVIAYLNFALRPLVDVRQWLTVARTTLATRKASLLLVIASYLAIELGIQAFAVGKAAVTPSQVVVQMAWRSVANPLVFAVSHLWFFGPVYLMFLARWREVVAAIRSLGDGLTLVAILLFLCLMDSESRRIIVLLPFAGLYLAKTLSLHRFRPAFYGLLAGMSLVFSRVWLPIRIDRPWSGPEFSPLLFPWQWFFMNLGPWLSDQVYIVAVVLLLAGLLVIWRPGKAAAHSG